MPRTSENAVALSAIRLHGNWEGMVFLITNLLYYEDWTVARRGANGLLIIANRELNDVKVSDGPAGFVS